jgi:ribosomal protein S8
MPKDQLSDFISRWNNRRRSSLMLLNSKKIKRIVSLLKEENYIDFKVVDETVKSLNLIITKDHIKCLKQMSKQSRYVYKSYNDLLTDSKLKQNLGFYILTNSE